MKRRFNLLLCTALFAGSYISYAQSTRVHTQNTNAWLMYFGNHKFTSRLGLHAEAQWRRSDFVSQPQQLLLRTGLDVYLQNYGRLTVGYAFIETYPYGDFPVPNAFPEHRTWQQYLTTQNSPRVKLSHRFRLEQRHIGNASTGEFEGGRFENRVRYMAKLIFPLAEKTKAQPFLAAYEEIFINFGKEVAYNIFDQNRLYGALGISLGKTTKAELGYLHQIVQLRSLDTTTGIRNRIENNHTLQISIFSTLSLAKE